jgi:hypothetical protein
MWKRNAISLLCRRLCEKGIDPDRIAAAFDWRSNRVWYVVDHRRWSCDDDELLHLNGKTYALSSQWGGEGWYRAMNLLRESYPQFKIAFSAAS